VNAMEPYRRAQDIFDAVLAAVPAKKWESPSACAQWTLRDVAGHVIWGQEQLRHWATGQQYGRTDGAPGALHPGDLAATNPVETFRSVRVAAVESLTREALGRTVRLPGVGDQPLASIITLLVTDHLAHTWDIAHALQLDIRLDIDLVAGSLAWARDNVVRFPGFFGPELSPPPDADEQARWLAYLGRAAWQPVPALPRMSELERGPGT
jgi:uncharacterized protein (TIGR03086 family)